MPMNRLLHFPKVKKRITSNDVNFLSISVRSFGTEDRPTDRPVPARDEIFEYIIFRGADIEDLQVREPPSSSLTQDPAIVEVYIFSPMAPKLSLFLFKVIGLFGQCSFQYYWNQHQSWRFAISPTIDL
jgi:hypothetical protein